MLKSACERDLTIDVTATADALNVGVHVVYDSMIPVDAHSDVSWARQDIVVHVAVLVGATDAVAAVARLRHPSLRPCASSTGSQEAAQSPVAMVSSR